MTQRIVVLNGFEAGDPVEARVNGALQHLAAQRRDVVQSVVVRDLRLGHCTGCFACFVRTPGECIVRDEAASALSQLVSSNVVVLVGRVSFGGYSAALKHMVDRVLPLLVPFFYKVRGETHHPARYDALPRIVAIGVENERDEQRERVFRALVARNAVNLHAPSHACEIVSSDVTDDDLIQQLRAAFERSDPVLWKDDLQALVPSPGPLSAWPDARPRRMLSVIGSPKVGPSTSGVIGACLEQRMRTHGWETESLTLKASLRGQTGRDELVSAALRADLVCLAFPLYIDSLHYLPTLALEVLAGASAQLGTGASSPRRFVAIANCGFPEARQNNVALAICERFAATPGWAWSGGLALGAGEALSGGAPLDGPKRGGRPPATHLLRALDLSAAALANGQAIPEAAQALCDRSPIPGLPGSWWRALFRTLGAHEWRHRARAHQVAARTLLARPIAPGPTTGPS